MQRINSFVLPRTHLLQYSRTIGVLFLLLCFLPQTGLALRLYAEDSPPGSFIKNGKVTGISTEIVRAIQKSIGDQSPISIVPWARGYKYLLNEPDVGLFSTTYTIERAPLFHWIGPLLRVKWCLYARKNAKIVINKLEDAKKVNRIGTYKHDAREHFLMKHGFTNLERSNSNMLNFKKLDRGHVDLVLGTNLGMRGIMESGEFKDNAFKEILTIKQVDLYLALSFDTDPDVVKAWQNGFERIVQQGEFDAIYSLWLPGQTPPVQ
ncbi:substrate-binding periplasmic protein [Desulfovibrio inopinatus]|uniref:substrate-binding periplasmic protein n=1 Tax=Desulfovibrio inopinatus TaxID=102109 RepID=UPI000427929C|nr:ABC transporter substrate-binding protein [Desulfovibrio inopinatus]